MLTRPALKKLIGVSTLNDGTSFAYLLAQVSDNTTEVLADSDQWVREPDCWVSSIKNSRSDRRTWSYPGSGEKCCIGIQTDQGFQRLHPLAD
jgi:hypothetical protein